MWMEITMDGKQPHRKPKKSTSLKRGIPRAEWSLLIRQIMLCFAGLGAFACSSSLFVAPMAVPAESLPQRWDLLELFLKLDQDEEHPDRKVAVDRLLQLSEEHGASFFVQAVRTLGPLHLSDESMVRTKLLKAIAPRDKEMLLPLLAKGRSSVNLVLAEILVEVGLDQKERDRIAPYILDVFTDKAVSPTDSAYARAAVLLAQLRPSTDLAAPRLVDLVSRRGRWRIADIVDRVVQPLGMYLPRRSDCPADDYAAYVLTKLGPYGPEARAHVPKLLAALQEFSWIEEAHVPHRAEPCSSLPADHGLDLEGLEDLQVLIVPQVRCGDLLMRLPPGTSLSPRVEKFRLMAQMFCGADTSASDVDTTALDAERIVLPDDSFSRGRLISDALVRIGPFAVPDLMKALSDPEMRYSAAIILSRMKPTPEGFVAKMGQWVDEDDPIVIYHGVVALHETALPEVRSVVERGVAKLEAYLQGGCKCGYHFALADAIGRVGHVDFACAYYASILRSEPVFADSQGRMLPAGPLRIPYSLRGLVRLGPPAIPTIRQFIDDDDWTIRFMAHVAMQALENQGHPTDGGAINARRDQETPPLDR
jgi:hypothetical protein